MSVRSHPGIACLVAAFGIVTAQGARADGFSSPFAIPLAAPAIGGWTTTVVPAPGNGVVSDPVWAAALAPKPPPTPKAGPVAHADTRPLLPGPRLNGQGHALTGVASYYWQGQTTAMGEAFDKHAMTAAHKTLPFGTKVKVTRVDNGDSVVVRINDRGPFKPGRVIDLSEGAAESLGITNAGIAPVRLEVLGQ